MEHLPTLRQIKYLVALDQHLNFQKAADTCGVTQPALSSGIRDMERLLGAPVLDRSSRRVKLSALGELLAKEGQDILNRMEEVIYRAHAVRKRLAWPLKMGVIPTIAPYLLPRILKPLQDYFPMLELNIHEVRSGPLVDMVMEGEMDFALMAFPFETKGLMQYPMLQENFACAAPAGMFPGRMSLEMADLQGENMLLLEDGHCLRDHALAACKFQSVKELKKFSAASLSTLIQMVNQGYGITLLPDMVVQAGMLPKGLQTFPLKDSPARKIGIALKEKSLRFEDIMMVGVALEKIIRGEPLGKTEKPAKTKASLKS